MNSNTWWRVLIVSLLALGLGIGCGEDGGEETPANNEEANQGTENNPNNHEHQAIAYESNYQLLFSEFFFSENPGQSLNPIIKSNMDQEIEYPIIVLVDLDDIDTDAETFRMRGGSGLKTSTDGEYVWDPDATSTDYAEGTISEEGQIRITLPLLEFVATVPTETGVFKTVIPIRQLEVDAYLSGDENGVVYIDRGDLTGYVTKEEADEVEIALSPTSVLPLTAVLQPGRLNYDSTGDGEIDAWRLKAKFSAEETIIVD